MKSSVVVASFVFVLAGCSGGERVVHEAARPCGPETVASYCASHACPTFDEDAAAVRKQGKDAIATGALYRYQIGNCGTMHVVRTQTMGVSETYYDASGHVVAMAGAADAPVCGDERSWNVGVAPTCTIETTERGGQP